MACGEPGWYNEMILEDIKKCKQEIIKINDDLKCKIAAEHNKCEICNIEFKSAFDRRYYLDITMCENCFIVAKETLKEAIKFKACQNKILATNKMTSTYPSQNHNTIDNFRSDKYIIFTNKFGLNSDIKKNKCTCSIDQLANFGCNCK